MEALYNSLAPVRFRILVPHKSIMNGTQYVFVNPSRRVSSYQIYPSMNDHVFLRSFAIHSANLVQTY